VSAQPINPALIAPVGATAPATPKPPTAKPGSSFAETLDRAAGLKFSGHALERVQRRGIDTSPQTLARLDGAVERAAAKGARDSVVLLDGTAFVVSVRNRTVITAVDAQSMREHVFTNIDSAVIG
jgi:flagellar operon protein